MYFPTNISHALYWWNKRMILFIGYSCCHRHSQLTAVIYLHENVSTAQGYGATSVNSNHDYGLLYSFVACQSAGVYPVLWHIYNHWHRPMPTDFVFPRTSDTIFTAIWDGHPLCNDKRQKNMPQEIILLISNQLLKYNSIKYDEAGKCIPPMAAF
jgi:hypothetical protein